MSGFKATTESEYKLSPSLTSPFQSGAGLPTPQYVRFRSGSYEPVTQIDPPPRFQESPDHVSCPGSPGPGIVLNRQSSSPVFGSMAAMKPRMPYSPPAEPRISLSFTTKGACVSEYPPVGSTICLLKTTAPLLASRATNRPSMVPM